MPLPERFRTAHTTAQAKPAPVLLCNAKKRDGCKCLNNAQNKLSAQSSFLPQTPLTRLPEFVCDYHLPPPPARRRYYAISALDRARILKGVPATT